MNNIKIIRSSKAIKDVTSIFNYIRITDNINSANYVIDKIDELIENLRLFPRKHPIEPMFKNPDIRFAIKWNYKIIFRISETEIEILSIFHTAQNPSKLKDY